MRFPFGAAALIAEAALQACSSAKIAKDGDIVIQSLKI